MLPHNICVYAAGTFPLGLFRSTDNFGLFGLLSPYIRPPAIILTKGRWNVQVTPHLTLTKD
jgi:hypothetical protein